ncbi:MAG: alpha-L-fucosidase, partial [Anaerolineaceae bacterium]|nr:alpha-L-fucosidase [Anaerolineaceae bacterium]
MKKITISFMLLVSVTFSFGTNYSKKDIPYWLKNYQKIYEENPQAAARAWFKNAKFGMFVHLNLASLCENGKADYLLWTEGEAPDRLLKYVGISRADYEAADNLDSLLFTKYLLPDFDAEKICQLAVKAKMKYITFTTLHLGRCYNYNTRISAFNSMNAPMHRDLVAELAKACKKYNLALFLYLPPEFAKTTPDRRELNLKVIKELLTNYGPIGGIWFDGIGNYYRKPEEYARLTETYEYIRSLQPQCLISFKEGATCDEDFITPEHFMLPFKYTFDTPERQKRYQIRVERWGAKNDNDVRWEKCNKYKLREVNTVMQECMGRDGKHVPSGWINDESARHLTANEVYYWLTYA